MNQQPATSLAGKEQGKSGFGRVLKIFLVLGCAGTVLIGGLLIWAAMTTVQHVADLGKDPKFQEQVDKVKGELAKIPTATTIGCWDKVLSMMDARVWLETPLAENITTIQQACWPSNQAPDDK